MSLDPKSRFSSRVADYTKFRPSYPEEFVDWVIERSSIQLHDVVADIGSGTGISSKLFLDRGLNVIGVEPNDEMRHAAESILSQHVIARSPASAGREAPKQSGGDEQTITTATFTSLAASAEATTLPDNSIDLIIAGQAFHWFDREKFRDECKRILKPGAKVALFWNERLIDATEFLLEYEELIKRFATDYSKVDHRRLDDQVIEALFQKKPEIAVFSNVQVLDFDGLKGRLMSSSYVPANDDPQTPLMLEELKQLFDRHQLDGKIELLYETKVYLSAL